MLGGPYSDVSSLLESGQTTEDGCEGDISDSDNDCSDWLQDFELVEPFLPEFWLILRVSNDRVDTFFHWRCVEWGGSGVGAVVIAGVGWSEEERDHYRRRRERVEGRSVCRSVGS